MPSIRTIQLHVTSGCCFYSFHTFSLPKLRKSDAHEVLERPRTSTRKPRLARQSHDTMESTSEGFRLTEANLRKLQPSLIRPMSPMSISSGDGDVLEQLATDERIARLKSWVYNAMQTLVGLGSEGRGVVEADELYVAGPGDVRLRGQDLEAAGLGAGEKEARNRAGHLPGQRMHTAEDGRPDADVVQPDLSDAKYWKTKLRYLEEKCQPLCQASRRKRRRLAPAADKTRAKPDERRKEDAAGTAEARPAADDVEGRQAERSRIEESKLLWRDKQDAIDAWIGGLPRELQTPPQRPLSLRADRPLAVEPPRAFSPSPLPSSRSSPFEDEPLVLGPGDGHSSDNSRHKSHSPSSDSSIIEITSTQFSHAVGGRQRASDAFTTAVAETAIQNNTTEGSGQERRASTTSPPRHQQQHEQEKQWDHQSGRTSPLPRPQSVAIMGPAASEMTAPPNAGAASTMKKKDGVGYMGLAHLTSPPESRGAPNAADTPFSVLGKRRRSEAADRREDGTWRMASQRSQGMAQRGA